MELIRCSGSQFDPALVPLFIEETERVEAGEEIVLARNGKAVARLVPVGRGVRRPGTMKGRIRIRRDFDAPLPAGIRKAFRGERK